MRTILNLCQVVFEIFILALIFDIIDGIYRAIRYKEQFALPEISKIQRNRKTVALAIVILIGLINEVLWLTIASTKIGAFYEKTEYEETYEATVYLDEKPIFCLADMRREINTEEGQNGRLKKSGIYYIDKIYLPYGKEIYTEDEYFPGKKSEIHLGEDEYADIVLERPADDSSAAKLSAEVVTAYGDYCGSREGEIYHFTGCISARNIDSNNLVFFESEREAIALGYAPCKRCFGY